MPVVHGTPYVVHASLTEEMDTYLRQFEEYCLECIDNAYR
jgi:hypothetical protein